jgi:hypothetical protein
MEIKEQKNDKGNKFDGSKLRLDLMSVPALIGYAMTLTYGAVKYEDHNWEKGLSWSRCIGAMLRHLFAFWMNENIDEESALFHIDQATFNSMALSHFQKTKTGTDDRYQNQDEMRQLFKDLMTQLNTVIEKGIEQKNKRLKSN